MVIVLERSLNRGDQLWSGSGASKTADLLIIEEEVTIVRLVLLALRTVDRLKIKFFLSLQSFHN